MKRVLGILAIASVLVACGNNGVEVTESEFGNEWPLTVSSGSISCLNEGGTKLALFEHNGQTYQLNGAAQSRGYTSINAIWKDNPNIPGAKMSIAPLINAALNEC